MNTWQNARFSALRRESVCADRVRLVSSAFHLRRSMLYFSHFGVRASPVRAHYVTGVLSWLPLSYHFTMTDLALHEYAGIPATIGTTRWAGTSPQCRSAPCARHPVREEHRAHGAHLQATRLASGSLVQRRQIDHEAIAHVALEHAFVGLVDVLDIDHLHVAGNAVLGAEIEHLLRLGDTADQ